tara:strand:+ start:373 stop:510 length:138 start_codon:yes stop_codon:yes gene_type:complete
MMEEEAKDLVISIEVAYKAAEKQNVILLKVTNGTTACGAIKLSNI